MRTRQQECNKCPTVANTSPVARSETIFFIGTRTDNDKDSVASMLHQQVESMYCTIAADGTRLERPNALEREQTPFR